MNSGVAVISGLLALIPAAQAQTATPKNWQICPAALDAASYKPEELYALVTGQGQADWLFGAMDWSVFPNPNPDLAVIKVLHDILQSRGTELILLFIPPRAGAQATQIGAVKGKAEPAELRRRYSAYIAALNAAGIYAPDVLKLQQEDPSALPYKDSD